MNTRSHGTKTSSKIVRDSVRLYRLLSGLSNSLVALKPRGLATIVSPGVSAGTANATA